ncbi:hypothetical protein HZA75_03170 [Candidatus Roizmanbacteria bacterium]|nr:hypothetical protein [Candidatus Roizmanbacteria bacterium]
MKIILVAIVIIFLNLLYLDWKVLVANTNKPPQKTEATQVQQVTPETPTKSTPVASTPTLTTSIAPQTQNNNTCSPGCLAAIKQATAGTGGTTTTPTQIVSSGVKEFYIPFGSGSTSSTDWQNVSGLQAYVDTGNYNSIKTVTFEASVHVPTGNETVNIRLFNVTDGHPVWYSDVFFNGGTNSQLLISQPITLDPGNKLYQVQMKAQLTFPAILDQARLHILTN